MFDESNAKTGLNAADASRVNASIEAISRAIQILPKLGQEGYDASASLQNASDFLVTLIRVQARNKLVLNEEIIRLRNLLEEANASI